MRLRSSIPFLPGWIFWLKHPLLWLRDYLLDQARGWMIALAALLIVGLSSHWISLSSENVGQWIELGVGLCLAVWRWGGLIFTIRKIRHEREHDE